MPAPQKFFDSFFKMATIAEEEEEEEDMDIDEAKDVASHNKCSSNNSTALKRSMPMSTLGDIIGYEPPKKRRRLY